MATDGLLTSVPDFHVSLLSLSESVPIIYYYYTHEVRQSNEKMNQKGKTKGKGH